jgi:hypothetical protein
MQEMILSDLVSYLRKKLLFSSYCYMNDVNIELTKHWKLTEECQQHAAVDKIQSHLLIASTPINCSRRVPINLSELKLGEVATVIPVPIARPKGT